jgi:GcrA cell cycle regulator
MGVIKWTDESKAIVRRLWVQEGLAASVIAARLAHVLGRPVTRNAIIGIAHRSGWALGGVERVRRQAANKGNGKTWKRKRKLTPAAQKPLSALARLMAEPFVPRSAPVAPKHVTLGQLADIGECKYPCSDGLPHTFCGHPAVPGLPYCDPHARICFVPPNPTRGPANRPHGLVNGDARLFVTDTRSLEVAE